MGSKLFYTTEFIQSFLNDLTLSKHSASNVCVSKSKGAVRVSVCACVCMCVYVCVCVCVWCIPQDWCRARALGPPCSSIWTSWRTSARISVDSAAKPTRSRVTLSSTSGPAHAPIHTCGLACWSTSNDRGVHVVLQSTVIC